MSAFLAALIFTVPVVTPVCASEPEPQATAAAEITEETEGADISEPAAGSTVLEEADEGMTTGDAPEGEMKEAASDENITEAPAAEEPAPENENEAASPDEETAVEVKTPEQEESAVVPEAEEAPGAEQETVPAETKKEEPGQEAPAQEKDAVDAEEVIEAVTEDTVIEGGREAADYAVEHEDKNGNLEYESSDTIDVGETKDLSTIRNVTWTSWTNSDPSVATLSNGVVKGLRSGCTWITGKGTKKIFDSETGESRVCGYTRKFCLYVTDVLKSFEIPTSCANITMNVGETKRIELISSPKYVRIDGTLEAVPRNKYVLTAEAGTYVTSHEIMYISISAHQPGKTSVTCTYTAHGKSIERTIKVTVLGEIPTSVSLDRSSASMKKGESLTLGSSVLPLNSYSSAVSWTSSDTKVATVSPKGVVKAVGEGKAVITCTSMANSFAEASCTVTVTPPVGKVALNRKSASVNKGGKITLKAAVSPANASNKAVTWKSSNAKVAKVSSTGVVTGVAKGTAVITCTSKDNPKLSASCRVTVKIPVAGVKLSRTSCTVRKGRGFTLVATVSPAAASNKAVTWKSSNPKVATVSSTGKVTGVKAGKAVITCTTKDGSKTAKCTITVK